MSKSDKKECRNCGVKLSLDSFYDNDDMCKWCLFSFEIRDAINKRTPICVECKHEMLVVTLVSASKWDTDKNYFVEDKYNSEGSKHKCHIPRCKCNFYPYEKKSRFEN